MLNPATRRGLRKLGNHDDDDLPLMFARGQGQALLSSGLHAQGALSE